MHFRWVEILFKINRESVTDVRAAATKVFAALDAAQPEGIRYASTLLADGETFVALLQLDDGVENPLPAFPEFQEFMTGVDEIFAMAHDIRGLAQALPCRAVNVNGAS